MLKTAIAMLAIHLLTGQAMAQSNCNFIKIAEDYTKARWPVDLTIDRRAVTSVDGSLVKVTFELPLDALGYVPEVSIDTQTCRVVSAKLWQ
jgi:hypothetical protein